MFEYQLMTDEQKELVKMVRQMRSEERRVGKECRL